MYCFSTGRLISNHVPPESLLSTYIVENTARMNAYSSSGIDALYNLVHQTSID